VLSSLGALACTNPTEVDGAAGQGLAAASTDEGVFARILVSAAVGIAVSGDIAYVSEPFANTVARIDLTRDTVTARIGVGSLPCFIVFNAVGTKAYVANQFSDNVSVIDVATGRQTDVIPVTGDPLPVAISADGNTLFTTTNVNKLFKIDLATKTVVASLDLPATSHHLLMHPDGTLLYVATRDAGSVLEVNWRSMTVVRTFTLGGRTQGMAISPDQQELYVADELGNVLQVVNLGTGATAATVPLQGGGEGLALSANGEKLYVGLVFVGKVQVLDRQARTTVAVITTGGTPREIAADPATQTVLVTNEAGWVDIVR
jgi:YVTN family beta-propeller protein